MQDLNSIIIKPRITEKASTQAEKNVYVFEVSAASDKRSISAAVKELYKVSPVKVSIVNLPKKAVFVRGKAGMKAGCRKAYVYLKKGDKIEFV